MIKTIKKALSTFVVMAMITTLMPMVAGASQLENVDQMVVSLSEYGSSNSDVLHTTTVDFDNEFFISNTGYVDFIFPELAVYDLTAAFTAENIQFLMRDAVNDPIVGVTSTISIEGAGNNIARVTFSDIAGPGHLGGIRKIALGVEGLENPSLADSYTMTFESVGNAYEGTYSAAYAIYDDEITVSAYIEPFITLSVSDNLIDLGELSNGVASFDSTTLQIDTNSSDGYRLGLESTDLLGVINSLGDTYAITNLNDDGEAIAIDTVSEGWGFNLVENPIAGVGANVTTNPDPRNSAATVEADTFGTPEAFFVPEGTVFTGSGETQAARSNGASLEHVFTLTAGAVIDALTPTSLYEATISVRVLAAF